MGGFMGVAAKQDCVFDLYFGIAYQSTILKMHLSELNLIKICRV